MIAITGPIKSLVEVLRRASSDRSARWVETDDSNVFLLAGPTGTVSISQFSDQDGVNTVLRVFNEEGTEVEKLHTWIGDDKFIGPDFLSVVLDEMFNNARRIAVNTDAVVSGLIEFVTNSGSQARNASTRAENQRMPWEDNPT